jgi:hypothetical protein
MSDHDIEDLIEDMRRLREEHAASPEQSRAFLTDAGILDEQGKLTEPYR